MPVVGTMWSVLVMRPLLLRSGGFTGLFHVKQVVAALRTQPRLLANGHYPTTP
jgi:hypothetical protein